MGSGWAADGVTGSRRRLTTRYKAEGDGRAVGRCVLITRIAGAAKGDGGTNRQSNMGRPRGRRKKGTSRRITSCVAALGPVAARRAFPAFYSRRNKAQPWGQTIVHPPSIRPARASPERATASWSAAYQIRPRHVEPKGAARRRRAAPLVPRKRPATSVGPNLNRSHNDHHGAWLERPRRACAWAAVVPSTGSPLWASPLIPPLAAGTAHKETSPQATVAYQHVAFLTILIMTLRALPGSASACGQCG
jgi:hypothetical protein